jgi:hypothetical protein
MERVQYWLAVGAQPSERVATILAQWATSRTRCICLSLHAPLTHSLLAGRRANLLPPPPRRIALEASKFFSVDHQFRSPGIYPTVAAIKKPIVEEKQATVPRTVPLEETSTLNQYMQQLRHMAASKTRMEREAAKPMPQADEAFAESLERPFFTDQELSDDDFSPTGFLDRLSQREIDEIAEKLNLHEAGEGEGEGEESDEIDREREEEEPVDRDDK